MSWSASFIVALLTALVGAAAAGVVAALTVDWYRISSFEGQSAYYVIAGILLGGIVGLGIGIATARVGAAGAAGTAPTFLRTLATAFGIVLGVSVLVAGTARALADVPPTIDGETLVLVVEVRWPAGVALPALPDSVAPALSLGAIGRFSQVQRTSKQGPLWLADAHPVDGRWVVPGAVELFTARGTRVLTVALGAPGTPVGIRLPLPAHPTRADLAWSAWLPAPRGGTSGTSGTPGATGTLDGLMLRFRVQRASDPLRVDTVGAFEVRTSAARFVLATIAGRQVFTADARTAVRHHGQPVPLGYVRRIAAVGGTRPALLVDASTPDGTAVCQLLVDDAGRLRIDPVASGGTLDGAGPVTADATPLDDRRTFGIGVDRTTFGATGWYAIGDAVLDAHTLTIRHAITDSAATISSDVPPLGHAPDGRHYARLAYGTTTGAPLVTVLDLAGGPAYSLPVDEARMPYGDAGVPGPAWLARYFVWTRGRDGRDRLAPRS